MVIVNEGTNKACYMDGYLYKNLLKAKDNIVDDWDFLFVVDGGERKGKSVFAQQLASFVDPDFSLKNIVFTPKQFEYAILNSKPYSCIIYDEAYGGINSRATMSKVNRSIVKMLTEIGSRNLYIIIVLPCFFELDKYVALWRSKALFHIYTMEDPKSTRIVRGFFTAHNEDNKKNLYIYGKKFLNYKVTNPDFRGRFTNKWLVDKSEYEQKKRKAQQEGEGLKEGIDEEVFKVKLFDYLMKNNNLSNALRADIMGMNQRTFYRHLNSYRADEKQDLALKKDLEEYEKVAADWKDETENAADDNESVIN